MQKTCGLFFTFALFVALSKGEHVRRGEKDGVKADRDLKQRNKHHNRNKREGGGGGGNVDGPEFIDDDDLPRGLQKKIGVEFKPGRKAKAQKKPDMTKGGPSKIRGLDHKMIELDPRKAERINVFNPKQYTLSEDGTFVTENETGKVVPLTVFYHNDEKNDQEILFAMDEDDGLIHARVTPNNKGQEGKGKFKVQNFQSVSGTDILAAYGDDDVDLTNAPPYGELWEKEYEKALPDDLVNIRPAERLDGDRRRRTQVASFPVTLFGKTCNSWDFLDVNIVTDKKFRDKYYNHQSQTQAIFAEAAEIYWKESCVRLYMWNYQNTVEDGWLWDYYPHLNKHSGCGSTFGALDLLRWECKRSHGNMYRDSWHMFTGVDFEDGGTIGCAYINSCQSKEYGYGVNHITWTTNLRLQAVLFAHELGHSLALNHLSGTWGYWVMEPRINFAPWDLNPSHASDVKYLLESSACGWY